MGCVMRSQPAADVLPAPDPEGRGASLYGAVVEYAIHCLLWLARPRETPASSRDLAELQGVSPAVVAKILPKLEKAGVVAAQSGITGGYRLARPADAITVLDIVEAVDGGKRVFDCKEVRLKCTLFGADPPEWASQGVCSIHAVMLRAETSMRREMARTTLQDLARTVGRKAPASFTENADGWLDGRVAGRERARVAAVRDSSRRRSTER